MPHGGKRNGAGRKPGSATEKTREVADRVAKEGLTPLEVMIEAMRHYQAKGDLDRAASIAKDCAPYIHPKLAAIEHSGNLTTEATLVIKRVTVSGDTGINGTAPRSTGEVLPV